MEFKKYEMTKSIGFQIFENSRPEQDNWVVHRSPEDILYIYTMVSHFVQQNISWVCQTKKKVRKLIRGTVKNWAWLPGIKLFRES